MLDLLIAGGHAPTGAGGALERRDIGICDGRVTAVEPEINEHSRERIEAAGHVVLPGLVDPHVHVSGRFGDGIGLSMLVRAGITAGLDLAGDPVDLRRQVDQRGCGLTIGTLYPLVPHDTIPSRDPTEHDIRRLLEAQLERGALGLKVLGGHYPLTPEATRLVIEVCADAGAYCAVHAGTTATGSDVSGLEELTTLAGDLPVHVAHVNSYCRGQIEDPVGEAARALAALQDAPTAWSDSYLSLLNGADATCEDGVPASGVVRTCLRLGGYPETQAGLEAAIADGWGRVQAERGGEIGFVDAAEGLALFAADSSVGISFPVNPPGAALAVGLARNPDRSFVVDAFGSDGGSIPRNTTLAQAIGLVRGGFLTFADLLEKAVRAPAGKLGLEGRGSLEPGAVADVIVLSRDGECRDSIIGGRLVMSSRRILLVRGGRMLTPLRSAL